MTELAFCGVADADKRDDAAGNDQAGRDHDARAVSRD